MERAPSRGGIALSPPLTWKDVHIGIELWSSVVRSVHARSSEPGVLRLLLHVTRAHMLQQRSMILPGEVTWSDPLVLDIQLIKLLWDELTDDERAEGERQFLQKHGPKCMVYNCPLPVRYAQLALGRRPTWELRVGRRGRQ